jgi:hypothetical protein
MAAAAAVIHHRRYYIYYYINGEVVEALNNSLHGRASGEPTAEILI